MSELISWAAVLLTLALVAGLWRSVIGPTLADRLLAIQLLGTGGVALCVLLMAAFDQPVMLDVALVLALLAAVGAIALTRQHWHSDNDGQQPSIHREEGERR